MNFIKKSFSNILLFLFLIFLFTPYGLPVRAFLIRQVSAVTTFVLPVEIKKTDREKLVDYNWKLQTLNGETVDLNSSKDKVVVINFWATWCPPCIAEMPSFQRLYDHFKADGEVVFLFIANDDPTKVQNFIRKKNYKLPVFFSVTKAPSELSSSSLPTTYVLDKEGAIVVRKVGALDWDNKKIIRLIEGIK